MVEENSMDNSDGFMIPKPPPFPRKETRKQFPNHTCVPNETRIMWDKMFQRGSQADVHVIAGNEETVAARAHRIVLSMASPVFENILNKSQLKHGVTLLRIPGIQSEAVVIFIRFLYSSCYQESEMKEYVLHLLVLSHAYRAPVLKKVCEQNLENGLLTHENVVDVLQLSRLCDAPRLTLICQRMIINNWKSLTLSEAWKVMMEANPDTEHGLVDLIVEADSRKQQRQKKREEKKVFLQLHQAMEALLHICQDGCTTIGPRDKALKPSLESVPCKFRACKGLESLIRHFYGCKMREPGGCIHCKRMWQLLELHSRMCDEPQICKVPLCQHFKVKMKQQSKKQEIKWRLLVRKVEAAKISALYSPH